MNREDLIKKNYIDELEKIDNKFNDEKSTESKGLGGFFKNIMSSKNEFGTNDVNLVEQLYNDKIKQEKTSLLKVDDSFKKIIVVGDEMPITRDDNGITIINIYDFLLKSNSLEL